MGGDAAAAARTADPQGTRVGRDRERDCGHESAVLAMNSSSAVFMLFMRRLMIFDDTMFMIFLMTAHFHGYGDGSRFICGSIFIRSSNNLSSGSWPFEYEMGIGSDNLEIDKKLELGKKTLIKVVQIQELYLSISFY
jgi:hypothetical protein